MDPGTPAAAETYSCHSTRCYDRPLFQGTTLMHVKIRRPALAVVCLPLLVTGLLSLHGSAQQPGRTSRAAAPALHATQPRRLLIRNAMVIYGNARPPN